MNPCLVFPSKLMTDRSWFFVHTGQEEDRAQEVADALEDAKVQLEDGLNELLSKWEEKLEDIKAQVLHKAAATRCLYSLRLVTTFNFALSIPV